MIIHEVQTKPLKPVLRGTIIIRYLLSAASSHHPMQDMVQLSISLGYCAGPPIGGVLKEVKERMWNFN